MDPNATLMQMHSDVLSEDIEGARESARDLSDWLKKGGFAPAGLTVESTLRFCETVELLCSMILPD